MSRYKVTYEDYTQIYGGSVIAEASWIRAYNQAEAMVSAMTFGRIRDRKSTRLNSSHANESRMPSSA